MPVLVGRAHANADAIVGAAGAPVDLVNKPVVTGNENVAGTDYVPGTTNARVQMGAGKKRSRTVRHKKRRTKNKTAARSRTGRRHKKHTVKKHAAKKHHKKTRSHRRKRHVKVHKQEGGTYEHTGAGALDMGAGPRGGSARGVIAPVENCNQ